MADYKYKFYAYVMWKEAAKINFVSIGVWEQIPQDKLLPMETLDKLKAQLKGLKRPSPFNFHWTPYPEQITLFRKRIQEFSMDMRIQVLDDTGNIVRILYWNFYGAKVIRFSGSSTNERVECSFSNFDTGDKQG